MKQKTWIVVILVGALAFNALAYMVVRGRRAATPVPPPSAPVAAEVAPSAPVAAPAVEDANAGLARARRAAGLAALEDRDYDKAVSEFTEALSLRKDKGDLVELLRIAADLRTREQSRKAAEPARAPHEPAVPPGRGGARTRAVRLASRSAQREEAPVPVAAEAAHNGLLLVTSTPPGLVVLVDGKATDLTPARVTVAAGTHRVALAQGERKLFEETVDVPDDSVRSINRDLSSELPPASPPAVLAARAPVTPPPAAVPAAAPAASPPVAVATPAPAAAETVPAVARAAVAGKGDLDVTSPSIYGEIWINSRPYGFPPVTADGLPAGPARIEVRVNGEVKRRMTVEVEPGRRTAVRVR
ncbi:PEGA domain-containing protein [Corallococcus sp. M34]|uniref:PEGA domain-containing protein n=1 Tax=Citreicoccus inhibens TaxID=2849499 RepID=UPI001C21DCCB|nr:PEGA domain-containing protein [Citreicoccus inhibens]MBU8898605.1 PEGA domain-containing protein [Citreicoccus inhibens]